MVEGVAAQQAPEEREASAAAEVQATPPPEPAATATSTSNSLRTRECDMQRIEILQAGAVVNTILADEAFAEAHYPGAWRLADMQPVPTSDLPAPRRITVGAFFDRFGPLKWAILADQNPQVQAVIRDASVRTYIDLDNADLPAGLALLIAAGHPIDAESVIDQPVLEEEKP